MKKRTYNHPPFFFIKWWSIEGRTFQLVEVITERRAEFVELIGFGFHVPLQGRVTC